MAHKHVGHENVVGGISMIGFPLVISVSEWDMPGIEPGPLGLHTSTLTNELQEVFIAFKFNCEGVWAWLVICYLAESISPKLELPKKGVDFSHLW